MLANHRSCIPRLSYTGLVINVAVSIAIGVRMPAPLASAEEAAAAANQRCDGWCTIPRRPLDQPPFFFHEFRHVWLSIAITFAIVRLIFEGAKSDISVVIVIVRLVGLIGQLQFTTWLCSNWRKFFYRKKIVPLLNLLSYTSFAFFFFAWSVYAIEEQSWVDFAVRFFCSPLAIVHYYWSKHWVLAYGPTDPARRFIAARSCSGIVCVLSFCMMVRDCVNVGAMLAFNNGYIQSFVLASFNTAIYHLQERRRVEISLNVDLVAGQLHSMERGLYAVNEDEDDDDEDEDGKDGGDFPSPTVAPAPAPVPTLVPASAPAPSATVAWAPADDASAASESEDGSDRPRHFSMARGASFKQRISESQRSLSKHKKDQDTAHLIQSKISALTCQAMFWYGLVFLAEAIVDFSYDVTWCDELDFNAADPLAHLQQFVDALF